jgi:hypothetical protein
LIRVITYFGYYPILLNYGYLDFRTEFENAETNVIPVTDALTFMLGILTIIMGYKSNNPLTDFFELTKRNIMQNYD